MSLKVLHIIRKNFREMIRSKLSSLIIVIGPILVILLAGFVFSTNTLQGVKIGTYYEQESTLGQNIEEKLREKSFIIQEFLILDECINSVKAGNNHLCMKIEEKRTSPLGRIDSRVDNNITLYIDYSKTRIVWTIINEVQTIIEGESQEATYVILESLSERVTYAISEINSKENELNILITRGEFLQNTLGDAEEDISFINNEIIQLGADSTIALTNINNFNNQMNSNINEIEEITGIIPATTNMRNLLEQNQQEIVIILNRIQEISNQITSNGINNQISTASQDLDYLLDNLRSIRSGIRNVNQEFNEFSGTFAEDIIDPIPTKYNSVAGNGEGETEQKLNFFDYILPGLIIMVIMFTSILLTSTLIIRERKTKAYLRSLLTPTSKGIFTFGTYITSLVIILIQSAILILITKLFFSSNILLQDYLTPLTILIISSLFISVGIIIGSLFNSEETGVIASVSLSIIFLISSSMIMSIEAMPFILGRIIQYTPFVLAETALRKIMIFQLPLINILPELMFISAFIVLSIVIISIIQSTLKNKEIF